MKLIVALSLLCTTGIVTALPMNLADMSEKNKAKVSSTAQPSSASVVMERPAAHHAAIASPTAQQPMQPFNTTGRLPLNVPVNAYQPVTAPQR